MSKEKDLEYYRKNAEEDYNTTPISVLRYISMKEENKQPNKEAKEVIEGLLKVLSHFEYLPNQYKCCLPAIEKAKTFLGK